MDAATVTVKLSRSGEYFVGKDVGSKDAVTSWLSDKEFVASVDSEPARFDGKTQTLALRTFHFHLLQLIVLFYPLPLRIGSSWYRLYFLDISEAKTPD